MKIVQLLLITILPFTHSLSQDVGSSDSTINNLKLPQDMKTVEIGAMPVYKKNGVGKVALILIAGWGFGGEIFDDFIKSNRQNYTMYSVTLPGFGKSSPQVLPPEGTSYGELTWTKGILLGLLKLIEREKMDKPIIVGHFTTGAQVAFLMATEHPEIIGGLIIIGGPAKFIAQKNGENIEPPLTQMVQGVDKYWAPKFYKTVTKKYFDDNNYSPELYSNNKSAGEGLWKQSASVPLPIMIQFLCEFYCTDISLDIEKVQCPTLIIRPGFTSDLLAESNPNTSYIKPQFIDSWNRFSENVNITIKDISNSGTFIWKDQPGALNQMMKGFITGLTSR